MTGRKQQQTAAQNHIGALKQRSKVFDEVLSQHLAYFFTNIIWPLVKYALSVGAIITGKILKWLFPATMWIGLFLDIIYIPASFTFYVGSVLLIGFVLWSLLGVMRAFSQSVADTKVAIPIDNRQEEQLNSHATNPQTSGWVRHWQRVRSFFEWQTGLPISRKLAWFMHYFVFFGGGVLILFYHYSVARNSSPVIMSPTFWALDHVATLPTHITSIVASIDEARQIGTSFIATSARKLTDWLSPLANLSWYLSAIVVAILAAGFIVWSKRR
jgi:hypothetical protein